MGVYSLSRTGQLAMDSGLVGTCVGVCVFCLIHVLSYHAIVYRM